MNNGFLRVAAACPPVSVADVDANVTNILALCRELDAKGVEIVVFPELSVTAYTCADLFHNQTLLDAADNGLRAIAEYTRSTKMAVIVGVPVRENGMLTNCGALVRDGRVDLVRKTFIPNYNEFYERRWFAPGVAMPDNTFEVAGVTIGIEICEDLWTPVPPSSLLALKGAQVMFNLSASNDVIGKYEYLMSLIKQQSARCICGYVYAGAGYGESSTDLVFDGKAIVAENGSILAANERWNPADNYVIADIDIEAIMRDRLHTTTFADSVLLHGGDLAGEPRDGQMPRDTSADDLESIAYRNVQPHPFVPPHDEQINQRCREIINIQVAGLAKRLDFIHARNIVVGVSGGLDSTLALLVACRTFDRLGLDRKGIVGITMPGFGTTDRTYNNAVQLMHELGVTVREIPIAAAVTQHFLDIGHDPAVHDVTYENSQARERTQILMDVANQIGAIVLGTGDLSELALGWATYNGDHMSMYGVNSGVPKTLVRYLVRWFADNALTGDERATLLDILDTPISPELTPADDNGQIAQKTEDLVGPYELHDFFLYYMLRYGFSPRRVLLLARKAFAGQYDDETLLHWLRTFYRRFFSQQFKRSCLPDGPKVGSVCLSPRGDWRMPSDASAALWLKQVDQL